MGHIYVTGKSSTEVVADLVELSVKVYVHGKSEDVLSKAYEDAVAYIKRTVSNIDAAAKIEADAFGRRADAFDAHKFFNDGESSRGLITVIGNVKIKAKNNESLVSVVTNVCTNYNTIREDAEPKRSKLFNYGIQGTNDKVALAIFAYANYIYSAECRDAAYGRLVKSAYNDALSKASLLLRECDTGLSELKLSNINLSSSNFIWLPDKSDKIEYKPIEQTSTKPSSSSSLSIAVEFQA